MIKNISNDVIKLTVSISICLLVAVVCSFFVKPAIPTWYASLHKPSFTPPNWVFGPIWIILYILMGESVFLIWRQNIKNKKVKIALLIFITQLTLNFLWPLLFFGLHSPIAALIDILFLWIAIIITIKRFLPISLLSGLLLFPYIFWVTYAIFLNISIVLLNY